MPVTRCPGSAAELAGLCQRLSPCVLLVDEDFLRETTTLHARLGASVRVLLETDNSSTPALQQLLQTGCWGLVSPKASVRTVARAVLAVAAGQFWVSRRELTLIVRSLLLAQAFGLTAREAEILRLLGQGFRNQEIAERLFLSVETVRWHLRSIYNKLGVHDRLSAAMCAVGMLELPCRTAEGEPNIGQVPATVAEDPPDR
jgi:DNA-binding NarL/FixJ family response regulator